MFNLLALNDAFCSRKQTQIHNLGFQSSNKRAFEQKVAQKQAGTKEKGREKALSCISVSFYYWSLASHPRQDISDAYEAPWCDLFWHIKSRPHSSTCIPLSFPS